MYEATSYPSSAHRATLSLVCKDAAGAGTATNTASSARKLKAKSLISKTETLLSTTKYRRTSTWRLVIAMFSTERPLDVRIGISIPLFFLLLPLATFLTGQYRSSSSHLTMFNFPPSTAQWIGCIVSPFLSFFPAGNGVRRLMFPVPYRATVISLSPFNKAVLNDSLSPSQLAQMFTCFSFLRL